jgi:hypothetical protein
METGETARLIEKVERREVNRGDKTDTGEGLGIRRGNPFTRIHVIGNDNFSGSYSRLNADQKYE